MDIGEIGSLPSPDYESYRSRGVRHGHGPQVPPAKTDGVDADAATDAASFSVPVNPYLVTSNTGPAGTRSDLQPGQYANYALFLFEEIRLNNESQILGLLGGGTSGGENLEDLFTQLGGSLSSAAERAEMGTVLYHLDGGGGIEDSHAAEGMGLEQFRREDGTFDVASALAEMVLLREGERSQAALEKEASYLDYSREMKSAGQWSELGRNFETLAAGGALARQARANPDFAANYAREPAAAVQGNLRDLTNHLMNTAIVYEKGKLASFY